MDYNSTREKLIIPEYGRNVQKMVAYVISIEDREKRTNLAKTLVNVMAQLHPDQRDTVDYKRKLWDHLHIIADYKLDIDGPYPAPAPEEKIKKPQSIPYPQEDIRFRPYGKNIAKMIEKACLFDDGPEKDALVKNIANHLKKSYLNWNRDSVNDELITEHLKVLSHGRLKLSEDTRLTHTSELLARNNPPAAIPHNQNNKRRKFNPKNDKNSNYRDMRNRKKN
ncbi:hypothetical protein TBC1_111425 [Lentimicrobium saccharophilum]|uniref:DUF4290 domain-containing protein n=1 Tax=Lentimicrobium saccharophilum TaxID=1678841 RepID=A0A0S7BXC2_9BACT|nr:DUF4290 domain-containing protein [Lentimicrobium saccharophilum]GAP43275.1 hypothetical protein TBC1_111425 [Lentimicrobium saccharophilum]